MLQTPAASLTPGRHTPQSLECQERRALTSQWGEWGDCWGGGVPSGRRTQECLSRSRGCPRRPILPALVSVPLSLSTDLIWEGPDGADITLGTGWVSGREEFQKLNTRWGGRQRAAGAHSGDTWKGRQGCRLEPPDSSCVCWRPPLPHSHRAAISRVQGTCATCVFNS